MQLLPDHEDSLNRLFIGDGLGTVIDQVILIGMPTLALTAGALSPSEVSLLSSAQWIPPLLLSGFFGSLVDSQGRRLVLTLAALMSSLGAAGMSLVSHVPTPLHLTYLVACCMLFASGAALFSVGSAANVPRLAKAISVPDALSAQASVRNISKIVGLAVAGPAIQFLGAVFGIALAAACSLVKAAVVVTIPPSESDEEHQRRAREDKSSAWSITLKHDVLRRLLISHATMNAGGAMVVSTFFAFAYEELKITPFSVGVMLFVGGATAVIASRMAKTLMNKFDAKTLCAVAGLFVGAVVWLVPASKYLPTLPTLFFYEALFSSAATIFSIAFSVVRQRLVPGHLLGKLIAVSSTAAAGAMVFGALLGAVVIKEFGLLAAVCCGCAFSSCGALALIRLTRADQVVGSAGSLEA